MTEPTPAPTPTPTPAPTPDAKPWHDGIDAETVGLWSNKGWKAEDPKALATELTKSYRELEKHFGVPADQILKLPKADAKPEEWKAVWSRLGAPAEAKDYDFSAIKFNGEPLEESFVTSMRDALAGAYVPKDKATAITAAVVKFLESADTAEATVTAAKIAEEKAALTKSWGPNAEFNRLKAMEGARRLGITPEAVTAMEKQIGYAAVMEAMRKIGVGTSEDNFVERGTGSNGSPTTREGAVARKAALMADGGWADRYLKGGVPERQEMDGLNFMIDGEKAA